LEEFAHKFEEHKKIVDDMISQIRVAWDARKQADDVALDFQNQADKAIYELEQIKLVLKQNTEELANQQAHIEQLLVRERELQQIHVSQGWKLLVVLYQIRDFLFPQESKMRITLKTIYRVIKDQKASGVSRENIKKFFRYLKTEDHSVLESRVNKYIEQTSQTEAKKLEVLDQEDVLTKLKFSLPDNPQVSIIIPVHNQFRFTYSCLKSILHHTQDVSYEIIIADDASTDETIRIGEYAESIRIIRNESNMGFLRNCNLTATYAKGQYIVFLNNDTNVQSGWLKALVDTLENDQSIGLVGSKLVYSNGKLQEAGGIIWDDASGWNYGRLDDPELPQYNYLKEVDYISGASIMIRVELWRTIGGFDDRYAPAYFEDSDLAFEVRKKGFKVVYQPSSVVVHFEGISHGTDTNSGMKSYQVQNREKFVDKWRNTLSKEQFPNGTEVYWARDRSRSKKTILVIDHYVPQYDKDAGSRTTFQYLKLFVKMGFNVKFIGDNFYRHEPYTTMLQQLGIEVLYGVWARDNWKKWIKDNANKLDFVYLNRPHISIKYIDFIRSNTNAKILYYGHDLHFVREKKRYEIEKNEELLRSSEKWKQIEFQLFEKSDVILTPSSLEKDIIASNFPINKVVVIPPFFYESIPKREMDFSRRKDLLFVGGFGHAPNIDAVLWFVESILPKLIAKLPNIKFIIVGSNPPQKIVQLASDNVVVKGYVSEEELAELYDSVRIVVLPLRYGAGVKGKTVEAMYYQVPIVTTSFGIEGLERIMDILEPKDTAEDFAKAITTLYDDVKNLNQISQEYFNYTSNHFTANNAKTKINVIM
jgi:GT2 family glycosyltransferase